MKKTFVSTLCEEASKNKDLVLVSGDLGFGILTPFWEQFPNRFLNAGICEQNMTALAAGLALEGKTVFTYSIGNFPTFRCLEQIRNDVCYHDVNVNIVAVGGGLGYGAMGVTHHATEDIAVMRALPGMTILSPADKSEAICATRIAAQTSGPCYLRLGNGGEPDLHEKAPGDIIKQVLPMQSGADAAIFATGPLVNEAICASKMLLSQGIHCAVYSVPCIKPLDKESIVKIAKKVKRIYTLEEHTIVGGLGGAVSETLAEHGMMPPLYRFGLNDTFSSTVGSTSYLREVYNLSAKAIHKKISDDFTLV